jgi:sialate O-acetylesterase
LIGQAVCLLVMSAICTLDLAASAEVKLPNILSSHAVLQRDQPIRIWGWAQPGEFVTVRFHGQTRSVSVDHLGKWSLYLVPEQAGGPYVLSVQGSSGYEIVLSDILVGDVWLASGQSNMQMPLKGYSSDTVVKNGQEEIAEAKLPRVRLLQVERRASYYPLDNITAKWSECSSQTAAEFSATAYFFGRELNARENVPIGLIDASRYGTPIHTWISMDRIGSDPGLMSIFGFWARFSDSLTERDLILAEENREDAAAEQERKPKPIHVWHGDGFPSQPASLYNGMIAPITPFAIKGVIWYQGETETHIDYRGETEIHNPGKNVPLYTRFFAGLIQDWRAQWGSNFPFLYVQISNFLPSPFEDDQAWGAIRDAQRRTLSIVPNTAMAVSLDVGMKDNVHPADKQTVGKRLALGARVLAYGESNLEDSGPLFLRTTTEGSAVRVWFDHVRSGLVAHGKELKGFEIAGSDGKFVPATAKIEGPSVIVRTQDVSHPAAVRYGWANWTDANLFNNENLPASAFTSE